MIFDRNFDEEKLCHFFLRNADQFSSSISDQVKRSGNGTLEQYMHKLCAKGTVACDMDEDGQINGVVVGYTHDLPADQSSYITYVIVDPACRGQGILGRLLAEYLDYCRQSHIRTVWLTTRKTNTTARHSYEKYGFVCTGEYSERTVRYEKQL